MKKIVLPLADATKRYDHAKATVQTTNAKIKRRAPSLKCPSTRCHEESRKIQRKPRTPSQATALTEEQIYTLLGSRKIE